MTFAGKVVSATEMFSGISQIVPLRQQSFNRRTRHVPLQFSRMAIARSSSTMWPSSKTITSSNPSASSPFVSLICEPCPV